MEITPVSQSFVPSADFPQLQGYVVLADSSAPKP